VTPAFGPAYAALYDDLYGDKPYEREAEWVMSEAESLIGSRPLKFLDVGCGTGRHAEWFARAGSVVAVDLSVDMIGIARERLQQFGSRACVLTADMTELAADQRIADESFDVSVCLFDTLGYAQTNERVAATVRGMVRATRRGGVVVVEVWHAAAMLAAFSPVGVRRVTSDGAQAVRIAETTLDVERQLAVVHYTTYALTAGDKPRTFEEVHVNRFFLAQELRQLLSREGLDVRKIQGGFGDTAVDSGAFHLVAVAVRP
jgi:SAM-dependent methyltransferase